VFVDFRNPQLPTDVDFKVMLTFLEFYETLLGFVQFKLYADLGLQYPPKIDTSLDAGAAGIHALLLQSNEDASKDAAAPVTKNEQKVRPFFRFFFFIFILWLNPVSSLRWSFLFYFFLFLFI
jgi:hypothetical protein